MRILEIMVATPLAQALGWTLLHSLWEGVAIAAGLGAVMVSTRSARVRYTTACLAMLAMVASAAFTLLHVMPSSVPAHALTIAPAPPTQLSATTVGFARASLSAFVPWLTPFWIVGVWILALGQIAGWISAARLRRRGVCSVPDRWHQEVARLRARLRVSAPVLLLDSCLVEIPVVIGHFRPVILMPIGILAGLPAGQIESILLHELAHIRRRDYLVNLLQRAVECLLFYHPAVWWVSRVIRTERENCCDDVVAASCGDVHEYAVALAALEHNRWSSRQPVLAATGGSLMKRIHRLLHPTAPSGAWSPLLASIILVGTAAAGLAAWPGREGRPATMSRQEATPGQSSVYDKWLNEDVVYLISDQERTKFLSLTSDPERDEFVQQFWERRNPAPGSPANSFKAEHYRRLAYANQHFSVTGPGWRSDRGRIYIEVGPPDGIDKSTPSWDEVWTYRAGRGARFYFKDISGNGDYRLRCAVESGTCSPAEDQTDGAVRVSENVANGNLIHRIDPGYPDIARAARVQSDVVCQVVIGADGSVRNIRVVSGHPMLVQAALDAIRQWRYKPFFVSGRTVDVTTQVTIPFRLPGTEATASQPPPDMSCTFYDQKTQPHDGVCEASERETNLFYCRPTDGTQPRQPQVGCEQKVRRLREWQQRQSQDE